MSQILRASGVPNKAIEHVPDIVNGCMVCRDWHRPGLQNVATFRLSLAFNEDVQFDLMFYRSVLQPERDQLV
eukprot:6594134-Karenia_brevis.AAC.1